MLRHNSRTRFFNLGNICENFQKTCFFAKNQIFGHFLALLVNIFKNIALIKNLKKLVLENCNIMIFKQF